MNDNDFVTKTQDYLKNIDVDFVKDVFVFNEVTSTNSKAKDLVTNNFNDGVIVVSKTQKSGRGRFKRVWESPVGGLYISFILKPDVIVDKSTLLPLVSAIAVSKSISLYGVSNKIKWPNDVLVNKKKIAGILLESEVYNNKLNYVILGIGVNLNIEKNFFSDEIKNCSTSILLEINKSVDYNKFLKNLILEFDKYYLLFKNKDYDKIISKWKTLSDTLNKKVKVISSSEEVIGTAVDIDEYGFLIVITDSGEYKKITSGDCLYFDVL